jgi:2'-5' RNA ligase
MRVFAALPVEEGLAGELRGSMVVWQDRHRHLKVVKPEQLHITLHFFGERNGVEVEELVNSLKSLEAGRVAASVAGISQFPRKGSARVYYLELEKGRKEVESLQRLFIGLIAPLGYRDEKRPFVPHITLARRKAPGEVGPFPGCTDLEGREFVFDRCVLYESRLSSKGPDYLTIAAVKLT